MTVTSNLGGPVPDRYAHRLAPSVTGTKPRTNYPVFRTLKGGPISDAYIRVLLKRLAARAGIEKRVHAHGLRHTHAAQLRAEGIDIAIISRQLGHASVTTTARYLDHLTPRAARETV